MSLKEAAEEMLRLYDSWPDQLVQSFAEAASIRAPAASPRSVVLCGMGGSGVTGDYVWGVATAKGLGIPVWVHKSDGVPRWLGREDLVVAISYSGNTYETLSCAREALARGAAVGAVTSGGKLGQLAREKGLPLALIRQGYYPRTALGMLAGATFGLLSAMGVKLVSDSEIQGAAEVLRGTSRGEGEAIARSLAGRKIIVVAGCGIMGIVAERWRQELSENAKVIAKTETYPESAHNDLVAWQALQDVSKGFVLVESSEGPLCAAVDELLSEVYSGQKDVVVRVAPRGDTPLARLLQGSLTAGYASTYLAMLNGIDPRVTSITGRYKELLEKRGLA